MNCEKTVKYFKSANGVNSIAYYVYIPKDKKPLGVVQIAHGMCEYLTRYEDFIGFLCDNGYIVCGNDHLGHGASVNSADELGFFAEKNGWRYLVKDVFKLTRIMQDEYPEFPYFMIGHSMGSLILRTLIAKYGDIYDGVILMGTVTLDFGMDLCLAVAETAARVKGKRSRLKFLDKMMFGLSNAKIDEPETNYDWICSDRNVVAAYAEDPECNFIFTAQGMYDLVMMVKYVSKRGWAEKVPSNLPIYIMGGAEDPIGQYGHAHKEMFERLMKAGAEDIELNIYENMRHEIINEVNKSEVYDDIKDWLDRHIEKEHSDN